jgi:hypothetical protein
MTVVVNHNAPPGDVVAAAAAVLLEWALEQLATEKCKQGSGPEEATRD